MAPVIPTDRYSSAMESSKAQPSTIGEDDSKPTPKCIVSEDDKEAAFPFWSSRNSAFDNKPTVLELYDDDDLKALLDEAIAYKRPKDREGKSEVFLQLLSKAEADDKEAFVNVSTTSRGHRSRGPATVSERGAAGGSLQNISSSIESDSQYTGTKRKYRQRQGPDSSVSSRQREGGSLPCNVNSGWTADPWQSEGVRKRDLIAVPTGSQGSAGATQARRQTLKHSASNELPTTDRATREPFPLRRHHSSSEQSEGRKMNDDSRTYKTGTMRLNFNQKEEVTPSVQSDYIYFGNEDLDENGELSVDERATTCFQLDSLEHNIPYSGESVRLPNGIGSVDLNWENRSVQTLVGNGSLTSDRPQAASIGLVSFDSENGRLIPIVGNQRPADRRQEDNGSVAGRVSGSAKKHIIKRKQTQERNVAVTRNSEDMPGHRSDIAVLSDLNVVVSFIESDGKPSKGLKKQSPKQKPKDRKQKNIKKASSLEELSQRNINDLTQNADDAKSRPEEQRRSWGDKMDFNPDNRSTLGYYTYGQTEVEEDNSDSEFQMVTKKTRRRRDMKEIEKRDRSRRKGKRSPRRKSTSSMPPGEMSEDSDLDSVQSLPAEAGRESNYHCDKVNPAARTSAFSAVQIKTQVFAPAVASPSSVPIVAPVHTPSQDLTTLSLNTEEFPSLPQKGGFKQEPKSEIMHPQARSKSVGPNTRPPVILLDERWHEDSRASGLTFGFEVNQELLQVSASTPTTRLSRNDEAIKKSPKPAWKPIVRQPTTHWPVEMPPRRYVYCSSQQRPPSEIAETLSFTTPNLTLVPPTSADAPKQSLDSSVSKTLKQSMPLSKPVAWKSSPAKAEGSCWKPCEPPTAPTSTKSLPTPAEAAAMSLKVTHLEQISPVLSASNQAISGSCPSECRVPFVMQHTPNSTSESINVSDTGTMTEEVVDISPQPASFVKKIEQDQACFVGQENPSECVDSDGSDEERPLQSLSSRRIVAYLRRKFNEALLSPDTVIYTEN